MVMLLSSLMLSWFHSDAWIEDKLMHRVDGIASDSSGEPQEIFLVPTRDFVNDAERYMDGGELLNPEKFVDEEDIPCNTSPNGRVIVTIEKDGSGVIWDASSGKRLAGIKGHQSKIDLIGFSSDGLRILTICLELNEQKLWIRRRPEQWWGLFCIRETWIVFTCGVGLAVSLLSDRRQNAFRGVSSRVLDIAK
ncbi:MAG: hypothetical protein M5U26_26490 [Planctomycetota bacterium]|nr:hypothetical protein [Planctomycetota bacterium]